MRVCGWMLLLGWTALFGACAGAPAGHPLLVMMHGAGGTPAGLQQWTGMDTAATDAGYITVFPEGLDESRDLGCGTCTSAGTQGIDDIRFIETLVRQLADSLPVDTTRVFLVGHSLGAQFVHYFACEALLVPAGIAAVSGLWWGGPRDDISALSMPEALERWSELLECGEEPEIVERFGPSGSRGGVQTTRRACRGGTSVVLQRIRGGGHGWPGATRAVPQLGPDSGVLDGVQEILSFFRPYALPSGR